MVRRNFIYALFLVTQSICGQSGIVINEFLASNETGIIDFQGEQSDWIELYNTEDTTIDITGFFLSDDLHDLEKWSFPSIEIKSHQHLVVFASGKDFFFDNEYHTNFKISKSGESLFLSNPFSVLLDSTTSISLEDDQSYGRITDGNELWSVQTETTVGKANAVPLLMTCSHESGFYESDFLLNFTTFSNQYQLRYTTDGTVPNASSSQFIKPILVNNSLNENYHISFIPTTPVDGKFTEFQWKFPHNIDKGIVVQYALFDRKNQLTATDSKIYFIGSYNYNMPIVSLVTDPNNLFDYDTGIYVPGVAYDLENGEYHPNGNYKMRGKEWEREVNFTYFDDEKNNVTSMNCGMRMKGVGSTSYAQKSFNLFFRNEYSANNFDYQIYENDTVDYYKRLTFRNSGQDFDRTHFKDAFLQELLMDLDLEVQRSRPSIVFFNGEYWGIHNIRDKFDEHYFKSIFGIEEDNINILTQCGNIDEGDNVDYFELVDFLSLNDISDDLIYDSVSKQIDILNFIDYHIAQIYYANYDIPCNNVKFWKTNDIDSKWRYLVYDLDYSFGESSLSSYDAFSLEHAVSDGNTWPHCNCSNFIYKQLLKNKSFENQFLDRFSYHLNNTFRVDVSLKLLDRYESVYRPEMQRHIDRWGYPSDIEEWESEIDVMRQFAINRPCFMKSNIEEYFGIDDFDFNCEGIDSREDQKNKLEIYPNPIDGNKITIEYDGYSEGSKCYVYDHLGRLLEERLVDQYPYIVDLSHLDIGSYLIKIDSDELIHTGKILVVE